MHAVTASMEPSEGVHSGPGGWGTGDRGRRGEGREGKGAVHGEGKGGRVGYW